jgi:hypothetical protein
MKLPITAVLLVALAGCQSAQPEPAPIVFEGEPYGEELTLAALTPVSDIVASPDAYVGERVLIEGTVTDVCDKAGCWMQIESGSAEIQVKVDDGVIVFPTSARGRTALVEGVVERRDLTAEEAFAAAAHRAEERGEPFDSTAVHTATTIYRIRGHGALIRS